jgi:hypothetical protein
MLVRTDPPNAIRVPACIRGLNAGAAYDIDERRRGVDTSAIVGFSGSTLGVYLSDPLVNRRHPTRLNFNRSSSIDSAGAIK